MAVDAARAKSLFLTASDLPDPAARAAYLDRECGGDAALRGRVEALLRANDPAPVDATGTFTPAAPGEPTADYPGRDEAVGAVLAGKYKLVEAIGEGGMGQVFLAQQTEPVKRTVAVKVIKAGMDTKAVLARFEAERQALALMDHPNIARVLDAGTTDTGRPYFVMELVKGVPITQFCDERRLTPRQRLELFVPVCQAIQHAHQKGVIHRDVKPSNVLVALYDDRPVPKVIDFGIAKAAGQTLTDKTLLTGFGAVVGTPEYMSPEQASLNNLDVDTRSDVYALGVLLYELLTGTTPVDRKALGQAALLEVLRVVREVEAPKPSAKLSTIDTLPSVAANRGTEPAKLSKLMKGELDWLVLKALEKDRTRRYETANGFTADVLRYLSGEPVQAVPPSTGYRLRKFVRKNRGPVAAGGLVGLTLLAGIAGTTTGLVRAEDKRREAERARADEAAQRQTATDERDRATRALAAERVARAAARRALDEMTAPAVEEPLARNVALTPQQRTFLEQALAQYEAFAAEIGDDPDTQEGAAAARLRVGDLFARLGRTGEALTAFGAARTRFARLAADRPADWAVRYGEASAAWGQVRAMFTIRHPETDVTSLAAVAAAERLAADFADRRDGHRLLYATLRGRANVLSQILNRGAEALAALDRAEPVVGRLFADQPEATEAVLTRADLLQTRLECRPQSRSVAEERERLAELLERAARGSPPSHDAANRAGTNRLDLSLSYHYTGDFERALSNAARAEEWFRDLVTTYPGDPEYRRMLCRACLCRGRSARALRRPDAEEVARQAVAAWEKLVRLCPDQTNMLQGLAAAEVTLAGVLADADRAGEAVRLFGAAEARLREVIAKSATDAWTQPDLRELSVERAQLYDRTGEYAKAVKDWDRVIELSSAASQPRYRASRAYSRLSAGQVVEAVAEVAELRKLPKRKWSALHLYNFACVYAIASTKIADRKAEYADAAMELLGQSVKAGWKDVAHTKADKDLDPLRGRDDFKKLLADLEAKFPPKREVLPPPRKG